MKWNFRKVKENVIVNMDQVAMIESHGPPSEEGYRVMITLASGRQIVIQGEDAVMFLVYLEHGV